MYKVKLESRFFVEVALNELDCSRPIVSREWRSTAALAKEPQVFLSLGDALRLVVDGDNLCPFLRVEFFLVRAYICLPDLAQSLISSLRPWFLQKS